MDLRCDRHKHAEWADGRLTVRCHQCSKAHGYAVFHTWVLRNAPSGAILTPLETTAETEREGGTP